MDNQAEKRQLRRVMVERILALEPAARRTEEAVLAGRFPHLPGYEAAGTVLLYVTAFPEEIATAPMLRDALERGKRLICPRVDRATRSLQLHEVADVEADFRRGTLGIPEPSRRCPAVPPERVDWVLVPGLAFDDRGFRLGRGAGHYDRLLPMLRPDVPRWALALDCQWIEALPVEPHDVPLDGVVSPCRTMHRLGGDRDPGAGL